MDHSVPALRLNSLLHCLLALVNAHSHNPHFVFPDVLVLLEHLLVVAHRLLARTAPGRPDVHEKNFSRLMSKFSFAIIEHIIDLPIVIERLSSFKRNIEIEVDFLFLRFLID